MNKKSDSLLISLYQAGNEAALSQLIERHKKELYSYIYYKILDTDLANDFFQDTFIKIISTLKEKRYKEEDKFILWAKRIAHNLVIDHFRLKAKVHLISDSTYNNDEYSIFDFLEEPEDSIEDQLITSQIYKDLHQMLVYLPENQQEVVKLRFFDGLSFKEIAEQTETSINTTLGRLRYALINLRKIKDDNKMVLSKQ